MPPNERPTRLILPIPETLHIAPFGEARVRRVLQQGPDNLVLRADLAGRDVVIKTPLPVQPTGFGEVLNGEYSGTLWTSYTTLGEAPSLDVDLRTRRALVADEVSRLKRNGPHWNIDWVEEGTTDVFHRGGVRESRRDAYEPSDVAPPDWPCLILPHYDGMTLADLPQTERLSFFRRMLPALWHALSGRHHGDLTPANLLLAPDRSLFRVLDPAAAVLVHGRAPWLLFAANPTYYPLLFPLARPEDARRLMAECKAHAPHEPRSGAVPEHVRAASGHVALAIAARDNVGLIAGIAEEAGRPSGADMQAMGLILFHLATGENLLVPDLFPVPVWVGQDAFGNDSVQRAIGALQSGYLNRKLDKVTDQRLAALIRSLVMLEIESGDEDEIEALA